MIHGFVIHLERATARRARAEALSATLPLSAEILPACDGSLLSPTEIDAVYRPGLHRPRYPFPLSPAEIACFLSHRRAWEILLARGLEAALIVEDDVETDEGFADVFAYAARRAGSNDYVRFPRWERGEEGVVVSEEGPLKLTEPFLPRLGTQMQLVGREAAERLLAASAPFDRPIDSFLQMQWVHGARILSARPIAIREVHMQLGGTVIQKKTMPLADKLRHEIRRPLLRYAVSRANRRWRSGGSRRAPDRFGGD